jgi:hypothetical protein
MVQLNYDASMNQISNYFNQSVILQNSKFPDKVQVLIPLENKGLLYWSDIKDRGQLQQQQAVLSLGQGL